MVTAGTSVALLWGRQASQSPAGDGHHQSRASLDQIKNGYYERREFWGNSRLFLCGANFGYDFLSVVPKSPLVYEKWSRLPVSRARTTTHIQKSVTIFPSRKQNSRQKTYQSTNM